MGSETGADARDLAQCRDCPRLAAYLDQARHSHPDYHNRPVPAFGDPGARLFIVGLAPGFHGANRSGRPFTGDHAGILLYATLHTFGYASRPESISAHDGLVLRDCRISNAVKCVPPANKPETEEIRRCNAYLQAELTTLPAGAAILALGQIAHKAVLMALGLKPAAYPFSHGARHLLPHPASRIGVAENNGDASLRLYDSYHCSRYNTQTRRLTPEMFHAVFACIQQET